MSYQTDSEKYYPCSACGKSIRAGASCTCPAAREAQEKENKLFLKLIFFVPAFIVKNLPALLPAWIIMGTLWQKVYSQFLDGVMLLAVNIGTVVLLTFAFWLLLRFLLDVIGKMPKSKRRIGYCLFWLYILGCYGGFGYMIAVESKYSFGVTIAVVAVACFLGAVSASKQMQLIEYEDNEAK